MDYHPLHKLNKSGFHSLSDESKEPYYWSANQERFHTNEFSDIHLFDAEYPRIKEPSSNLSIGYSVVYPSGVSKINITVYFNDVPICDIWNNELKTKNEIMLQVSDPYKNEMQEIILNTITKDSIVFNDRCTKTGFSNNYLPNLFNIKNMAGHQYIINKIKEVSLRGKIDDRVLVFKLDRSHRIYIPKNSSKNFNSTKENYNRIYVSPRKSNAPPL